MPAAELKFPPASVSQDRPLPEDLLRDASRRVGIMALVGAVLWVLGVALGRLAYWTLYHGQRDIPGWDATDVIATTAVVASLALFFYTRRSDRNPRVITDLGLVYVVLTAL